MIEAYSSRLWAGSQQHLCMHPYFVLVPLLVCPQEHVRRYIVSTPDEHLRDSDNPVTLWTQHLMARKKCSSASTVLVRPLPQSTPQQINNG